MANQISRRRAIQLFGVTGLATGLAGCGGSLDDGAEQDGGEAGGPVTIGLLLPQSGVYAPVGTDMQRGWQLWLDANGGRLAGREITVVTADEGEGPQTAIPAAQRLLQADGCHVIVGVVNSAVALGLVDPVTEAGRLLLVTNAGANAVTGAARNPHVWRTSFDNAQSAAAMGEHLATTEFAEGVFAIAPDYAAGEEIVAAFEETFTAGGGTIVDRASPPFGTTQDYQPFLSRIRSSGAAATFAFFAGGEAVSFVQQYAQFGLAGEIPLYGTGFLTEGGVLDAQGDAAQGVRTELHYSSELDNPANREFVRRYTEAYDAAPTVYSVQAWDAAFVLDAALGTAEGLGGQQLAAALGELGEISDSPRGPWSFDGQSPRQNVYLREVRRQGDRLVNAVTEELGPRAQTS